MWIGFAVGLLGTAALPFLVGTTIESINGPRPSARRTKAAADILGIEEALQLYTAEHGGIPTAEQGLAALVPDELVKFPIDPWGNPYVYMPEGDTSHVVSYGSDGKPGGEGDAADISRAEVERERSTEPKSPRVPDATANALLLGSILLLPFVAYLATDRSPWAVGVLAGAAGFFAALPFTLGVVVVFHAGIRAWVPLLVGLSFAGGTVAVLLRVRYSDGTVMTAMAALVAGLWLLSRMVVR
jgi:general secretion pathway protein G